MAHGLLPLLMLSQLWERLYGRIAAIHVAPSEPSGGVAQAVADAPDCAFCGIAPGVGLVYGSQLRPVSAHPMGCCDDCARRSLLIACMRALCPDGHPGPGIDATDHCGKCRWLRRARRERRDPDNGQCARERFLVAAVSISGHRGCKIDQHGLRHVLDHSSR